ncbi:hypothetical protein GCM10011367_00980 [Marinicauda pacifica]|jgi:hypothetical protein|uniref:Glutathione S-transferase n=1 Tax=Marinicauda pacifica TaxID=1133559 RepID=A0A4S2HCU5_9PROT|nr:MULTISPECIES: MAPEG family protein [Marinicauda]TGY93806.1 glutathione S-transferase [Marinicauda pacifica]GGE30447.1 hypothetical protein GCM10011367_00980 [Marinicauda pacifica]
MTALHAAALYIGLNLLILLFIGFRVSIVRRRLKVNIGTGGFAEMERAVRTHANGAEWVPAALLGLLALALVNAPASAIHVFGAALTLARLAHAYGLSTSDAATPGRFIGSLGTLLVYLLMAVALIAYAVI